MARILGVFAHPDDEVFCAGGTFAKYAAEGAEVRIVSFTKGDAGQIRDASVATRRTLGRVRPRELELACAELGVQSCQCLDYGDGTLASVDMGVLVAEVDRILGEFEPDVVITFGADGAYGHPDHVAVGEATTKACAERGGVRLFHSQFPRSRMLMLDRLATVARGAERAIPGHRRLRPRAVDLRPGDHHPRLRGRPRRRVRGTRPAPTSSSRARRRGRCTSSSPAKPRWSRRPPEGERRLLAKRGPGEFVGELGIAYGAPRMANVIAVDSVTTLVFSLGEPAAYEGRGGLRTRTLVGQPWLPTGGPLHSECHHPDRRGGPGLQEGRRHRRPPHAVPGRAGHVPGADAPRDVRHRVLHTGALPRRPTSR